MYETMSLIEDKEKQQFREWNPQTLSVLMQKGIDLSICRSVVNVFFVFEETEVKPFERLLSKKNMRCKKILEMTEENQPTYWSLHAELMIVLVLDSVHEMTDMCVDLANECNGEYDGWYTEIDEE